MSKVVGVEEGGGQPPSPYNIFTGENRYHQWSYSCTYSGNIVLQVVADGQSPTFVSSLNEIRRRRTDKMEDFFFHQGKQRIRERQVLVFKQPKRGARVYHEKCGIGLP